MVFIKVVGMVRRSAARIISKANMGWMNAGAAAYTRFGITHLQYPGVGRIVMAHKMASTNTGRFIGCAAPRFPRGSPGNFGGFGAGCGLLITGGHLTLAAKFRGE
jgi:hypothetical protein